MELGELGRCTAVAWRIAARLRAGDGLLRAQHFKERPSRPILRRYAHLSAVALALGWALRLPRAR